MTDPLNDFFGPGNEIKPPEMDPPMHALLDSWQATIRSGGVGFLPRCVQQRTYWYSFAPSARRRRELLELLDAWVGPTYSDLAMGRGELEPSDPFDAALSALDVAPLRFEVLPRATPYAVGAKTAVRNALTTLTRLANERPPSQFDAMRTTVEVLDDLGHAISARDRALAEDCITELEHSADLDESNLAFLKLRLYAGMRDWTAMFADPVLAYVLAMRRPLGVTRVIQSGLYFEQFKDLDQPGAESALRAAAEQMEPALRDLYTGAPPGNRAAAVVELVCRLLATPSSVDPAVEKLVGVASSIEPGLDEQFRRIIQAFVPTEIPPEPGPELPTAQSVASPEGEIASLMLQGSFAACIELGIRSEPSVEAGRALVVSARQLSSIEWAAKVVGYLASHELKEAVAATAPMFRADVEWLESICGESPARGWAGWFASLHDPEIGRMQLPNEALQSWDPLPADELVLLLTQASDATLAALGEHGGQFLAAHDCLVDLPTGAEVTVKLLAAMALSEKASAGIRVQTLALLESLSAIGAPQATFEESLEWVAMILEANTASITVSWACDIVQTLTAIPAPGSAEAVLSFYYKTIEAMRPYRSALDDTDVEALEIVAAELGTQVPSDFHPDPTQAAREDPADAYRYLEGKTVVLHSLMEPAITRASQVLKRLLPSIDVRTDSQHDGSPQLAQLSAHADVFVIVTAAAKHAATTFIADHRRGLPTILVNSRGSSAILRALEEFNI